MDEKMTSDESKIANAVVDIFLNIMFVNYAKATVVLGRRLPGEKVPFEEFAHGIGVKENYNRFTPMGADECVIDEYGTTAKRDIDEYYRRTFYNFEMSVLFDRAPMKAKEFGDDGMFDFCDEERKYINGCFETFCRVADMDFEYDAFDLAMNVSYDDIVGTQSALKKLVTDIYLKKLKKGKNVSKYFNGVKYVPAPVNNLVRRVKSQYVLENADINSDDYKLAVLSLMNFVSAENQALWLMKCDRWKSLREENAENR